MEVLYQLSYPGGRAWKPFENADFGLIARAYSELRKRGLVSRQGRHGMVVQAADEARERMTARESAHEV
ncbi:MAG: hypothetical protein AB7T48_04285, partial [Solirubrobacterales bacterium]